jgi:uncharacterized membrane protein YfcA
MVTLLIKECKRRLFAVISLWLLVLILVFPAPFELISHQWVILPIAFLTAVFANATAIGGGFLFVPLFIFGYGLTSLEALKLSLATQAFGMTSGSLGWSWQAIMSKALLLATVGSVAGMAIGTYVWHPSNVMIKKSFGVVSIITGIVILLEMKYGAKNHAEQLRPTKLPEDILFIIVCFLGGIINAWVSIAIGEVVALWLLFMHKIRIEYAIATGVASLAICSIFGFLFHIHLGGIRWEMLAFTVPAVILGGYYGAKIGAYLEKGLKNKIQYQIGTLKEFSPLKVIFIVVAFLNGIFMIMN